MSQHTLEVSQGERFTFGKNWSRFLSYLNEDRVGQACTSLTNMLEVPDLKGCRFLDIGSGSGLFSLAARRLGASVHSFDYDPASVACTLDLRARFFPDDSDWTVEEGSVLDAAYLEKLGQFDIVYSWGVLHHTGAMWEALSHVAPLTLPGGKLFLSLYNDQGRASKIWCAIKQIYNQSPGPLKPLIILPSFVRLWGPTMLRDLLRGRPGHSWRIYHSRRGMSPWHDVVDWVGGYPFEVTRPEEIFDFYRERGYTLLRLKTCGGGHGCNEYVFKKSRSL